MSKYKKHISYLLYVASLLAIIGVGLDTIIISEKYIASEKKLIYMALFITTSFCL